MKINRQAAEPLIVVKVSPRRWKLAEWAGTDYQIGNDDLPVEVYAVAPGRPYRRLKQALEDGRLIMQRLKGKSR